MVVPMLFEAFGLLYGESTTARLHGKRIAPWDVMPKTHPVGIEMKRGPSDSPTRNPVALPCARRALHHKHGESIPQSDENFMQNYFSADEFHAFALPVQRITLTRQSLPSQIVK